MSGLQLVTLVLYAAVVLAWLWLGYRTLVRPGARRRADIRQLVLLTVVVAGLSLVQITSFAS